MKDSIMIFGGGINQLTLIDSAKGLGLTTVVLDPNADAPGKSIADFFYAVPGGDYETTKEIALRHRVGGVVTSEMEKPLKLMARLAQELGFIFHSSDVVAKGTDKFLMKRAFLDAGVPCAKGVLIGKNDVIDTDSLRDLSLPLILKPRDATSSQGVYKIDRYEEIRKYIGTTRRFSSGGDVLVEEFLDGPELSVESITFRGKTTVVQYTEKFITPFPRTVELAHLQPARLADSVRKSIDDVVGKAVDSIGIDNSASHTEVKLTGEGPKVVEIGPRLGGDFISSYLVLHSCGVNMDRAAVQVALGMSPDLSPTINQYSFIKYLELGAGRRVIRVDRWDDVLTEPGVVFAHVGVKQGDVIPEITESSQRPGFVIVAADDRAAVLSRGRSCARRLEESVELE